jgi:hypothetical protein
MHKEMLQKKVARLETELDLLQTEFSQVNAKLKECGFPEGIATLKETMEELLHEGPFVPKAISGELDFEI